MTAPTQAPGHTDRSTARGPRFWIVLGGILIAVVVVVLLVRGTGDSGGTPLAGGNPAPQGGKAVVEVLRQHGVRVHVAASLAAARAHAPGATVLLSDPNEYLDDAQLRGLGDDAAGLVLVEPGFAALHALAPDVAPAGRPQHGGALMARCSVGAALRAGTISGSDSVYRAKGDAAVACFPSGDGAAAMVVSTRAGHAVTVVGSTAVFANESVIEKGNAALALGLLGERADLVWYLPTEADVAASGPPSLAKLTPGWVTPAALLAIAVFVAAAVWRGRRFGPLVIENLPVVVRAEETMEGRARLYQRSSARVRAIDALRIASISRIAVIAGLPRSAPLDAVLAAAADLSGRSPQDIRQILVDAAPRSDADLMGLAQRLDELETEVRASAHHGDRSAPRRPTDTRTGE